LKKLIPMLLAFVLILSLIPNNIFTQQISAAEDDIIPAFQFPNEKYKKNEARIVSNRYVTLNGTLNGIIGSSISYKVEQITLTSDKPSNYTEQITTGIVVSGNQITVSNVQLFSGLNKITFSGVLNGQRFDDYPFYIEYRDSPILHDLKVGFETETYDLLENGITMLYSRSDIPQTTGSISINGYAPNASKVTVIINGSSYDYMVSQTSNSFRFVVPQLTINEGLNAITFKVSNGGQVVETTRQVALYTGNVTYYDEKITNDSKTYDLTYGSSYSVDNDEDITISGKAIIPLPLYNGATRIENTDIAGVNAALQTNMRIVVSGVAAADTPAVAFTYDPAELTATAKHLVVNYSYNFDDGVLPLNTDITFTYRAPNLDQGINTSSTRRFTLRDGTKAFIADINYLAGFDGTMTETITGVEDEIRVVDPVRLVNLPSDNIDLTTGANIYSLPIALEVVISNYGDLDLNTLTEDLLLTVNGKAGKYKLLTTDTAGTPLTAIKTATIDGVEVQQLRIFLQLDNLDKSGTNVLRLSFDASANAVIDPFQVTLNLQYGPYVRFESISDGMSIPFDSLTADENFLFNEIGALVGRLMNVANPADIVYKTENGDRQTVTLLLNNVPVELVGVTGTNSPLFAPKGVTVDPNTGAVTAITDPTEVQKLISYLNKTGENTVKFIFRTTTYNYESTLRFNIVPKNLPVVPADKDGVYPYTKEAWPPSASDSNFTYSNGVFTTKKAEFNVYGSFDFLDLGKTYDAVRSKLTDDISEDVQKGYMIQISSPEWSEPKVWDLSRELYFTDGNRTVQRNDAGLELMVGEGKVTGATSGEIDNNPNKVKVYYNLATQSFFFNIVDEKLPVDGSPLVYTISVFNAGEFGPRATYSIEVNSISIPYKIEIPANIEQNHIVNQNYLEVIISAPGADSMTINKEQAEAIDYYDYSTTNEVGVEKAFRAYVTLKSANKDIEIPFTIKRGDTTTTSSFKVRYVPTNIPGAQYMEAMKSSHKVFNGALSLSFPKNTNLIRSTYLNSSDKSSTQVYNGNDILFAIAHPDDGIVDRHNFENQASGYSSVSTSLGNLHIKTRFESDAGRFIKASPLYWIDAGLADDSDTDNVYDPITRGLDPFPFPRSVDVKDYPRFTDRVSYKDREILPSNPGTLTLSYDSNIVSSAGTTISVFRFDPYNSIWENIGGVVDEKKGTVSVPFTKFGYYVVVKLTRSYNDIIDHSYAREAMEAIYAKGIMNAVDTVGRFGGDEYITRGEFTRMIVKALELPLNYDGALHFTYYPETVTNQYNPNAIYDIRYIETAARAGIVNGTRPGFFGEDVSITRQDAAVILARALELKLETNATKARNDLDKAFKDGAAFDYYAIPAVLAVQKQGFIVGKPINTADPKEGYVYDPKARMLRSDAAIIMARVMNKLKKLPKLYG